MKPTREQVEQWVKKSGVATHGIGYTAWEGQLEHFAALAYAAGQASKVTEGWKLVPVEPTEELIDATRSLFLGLGLGINTIEGMRNHFEMIGEDMSIFPDWFKTGVGHLTKAGQGILAYCMILAAAPSQEGGAA